MPNPFPFGELPDAAQNLLCSAAILTVQLDRPADDPAEQARRLRELADHLGTEAYEVVQLVAGLLDRVLAVEAETTHLREQLEKIGRKAFWARGRDGAPRDPEA